MDAQTVQTEKKMTAYMVHYYKYKDDPEWRAAYNERKTKEAMKRYHSNEEERRKKIELAKSRYWRLKAEREAIIK